MQRQARTEREWGQWPGRRPADHVGRDRLRTLFAPSHGPESPPLEDGAGLNALKRAYAELDERERRAEELQSNVEQLLRDESASLDSRQEELDARDAALRRRAGALATTEAEVEARRRELGAVELRSAALERREEAAHAREVALELRADELASLARSVTELGETFVPDPTVASEQEHVVLEAGDRYLVRIGSGPAPAIGAIVELEGSEGVCVALTRSPFPADRRRCAVVERVAPADQPSQASSNASPKKSPITAPAASAGT